MKVIKKFTAVIIGQEKVNHEINTTFSFGEISGPYYDEKVPETEHDSEDAAIAYAYKTDKYATWVILPIINFDNSKNG